MSRDSAYASLVQLTNESYMEMALAEAELTGQANEVPIGAILVGADGGLLARARNSTISRVDPTGHAEILAIREAARTIGNYRLTGATLFVTIEPCVMCMGAALHARLARVVFGAPDPKWGAAGSLFSFHTDNRFNHRITVVGGVLEEPCRKLMQHFFSIRRQKVPPPAVGTSVDVVDAPNKRSI